VDFSVVFGTIKQTLTIDSPLYCSPHFLFVGRNGGENSLKFFLEMAYI